MKKQDQSKLELWQDRLAQADHAWNNELVKMDERERLYAGDHHLKKVTENYCYETTPHVRNIVFENIEAEISSAIPMPKVTPKRKEDEHLAEIIEHFLRNELDRLPFETINDMAERTTLLQGGVGFLVDWDNSKITHDTVGEVVITPIHPKQFAPQPGVFTGIEDMDWFILKIPTTKETIKRRYGKDVHAENESEPEIRTLDGEQNNEDAVTQYIGYGRNKDGAIDRYSWVNDVELEDIENYQARRQPVCSKCGKVKPLPGQLIYNTVKAHGNLLPDPKRGFEGSLIPEDQLLEMGSGIGLAENIADSYMSGLEDDNPVTGISFEAGEKPDTKADRYHGGPCPWCGSEDFTDEEQEFEEIMLPMQTMGGVSIPGATPMMNEAGMPVMQPTLVPFYKPECYPIILQKSVSVYGQLLGNSDADVIADQQNTLNALSRKIIDRIIKAGSRITLPDRADFRIDPHDGDKWYIGNAADKNLIGVYDFKGDLNYELAYMQQVYQEAREMLGITDSFQGRADRTAQSGKAKEFAAAQSAGRLESKRVMKNAAYAGIFEMIFKFWLAYGDEPRSVTYKDEKGNSRYEEFNRYDFLLQDEDGNYYWNDNFLFSVDTNGTLANNRDAMWQECRENLQSGAFGNPADTQTLILFWSRMEELHYPGAGQTKSILEERAEQEAQMQQQMMQQQAMMGGAPMAGGMPPQGGAPMM